MNKKCLGCGISLQNTNPKADGYIEDFDKNLCKRCFKISNYGEHTNTERGNKDFINILNQIPKDSLVVYVTSLLNINLEYINVFKKVLIVLTKRDILPKSINDEKIKKYVNSRYKVNDIEVVCSIKNYNLDSLYKKILDQSDNKKVYIIGSTNSGKSTLLNSIIKNYSNIENKITTSLFPSTTLGSIELNINKDLTIVDTPGILNKDSIYNSISNKVLKRITPKKEIKPITYQLSGKGTILIDDLVRMEYNINSSATFYLANGLKIQKINSQRRELLDGIKKEFILNKNEDIVIEDLGFIKFTNSGNINIYTEKNVNIYKRDNLI